MNTAFDDNDLDQLLQSAADEINLQWSKESALPPLPADCPTMPRMYEAILREDWTETELTAIERTPEAQSLLSKINDSVWYPTKLQLFKHSIDQLDGPELEDVSYHLEVDRCKRSLRLFNWMKAPLGFRSLIPNLFARVTETPMLDRIAQILSDTFGTQATFQPILVPSGAATARSSSQEALFDNGKRSVNLYKETVGKTIIDCLTVESHEDPAGTLMRLVVVDDDGLPVETRFLVLRPGSTGKSSVGELFLNSPVPKNCSFYCLVTNVRDLADKDAERLREDFKSVQTFAPSSVESWKKMGEERSFKSRSANAAHDRGHSCGSQVRNRGKEYSGGDLAPIAVS